jgi:hypothetical protein
MNGVNNGMIKGLRNFWQEEEGLGTVEMLLILATLVGVAILFRNYIIDFADRWMPKVPDPPPNPGLDPLQ